MEINLKEREPTPIHFINKRKDQRDSGFILGRPLILPKETKYSFVYSKLEKRSR